MKFYLLILSVLLLVGCQTTENNSVEETQANVETETIVEESNAVQDTILETGSKEIRPDGVPVAWTDYSAYANPNEEGYAYEIHPDSDISSEILPITESSSDVVLFTFDDAPQTPGSHAIEMAELMKSKDVNAIFLVNGMYLESEENIQIVKTIHDMGFEIGNHTETHENLRELTYEEQYYQLKTTNDKILEITGEPVRWFRPPFGLYNSETVSICNELGLQLMTWSFGYDWMDEYLEAEPLAQVSLDNKYLRGGANILMHDRSWTYGALEKMIDGYREMGYHIVDPYLIKHQRNVEY
ncbi:polysaccharide deacetylase family protein [Aerococcaceae bacterium DSM 111022]|nr:polysaccharide deacetylase family protein [Aerococcaceae bacterium DSM 111022]